MPEHVEYIRRHKIGKWLFYRFLTFPTLRRAKMILCTGKIESKPVQDILRKKIPILIVPNGIELEGLPTVKPPSLEDRLVLTYIGRISHEKGINTFLRGWLRSRRPGDTFMVAGAKSGLAEEAYFEQFLGIIAESGGSIAYHGYLDSLGINNLIGLSHFVVLPSGLDGDVRENFGIAVAEAMAMGRPVMVCRDLEWDDVEEFGAGFVFDRHLNAVISAIRRATETKTEDWLEMATQARRYAERRLDIRVTAQQIWDALIGYVDHK